MIKILGKIILDEKLGNKIVYFKKAKAGDKLKRNRKIKKSYPQA